jgi:hypothetical protein
VAGYAAFHGNGNLRGGDGIPLHHRAVADAALDLPMLRMAEDHEIFYEVDLRCGERCGIIAQGLKPLDLGAVLLQGAMAVHTLRHRRERSLVAGFNGRVAVAALDLQRRVFLMAEVDRLLGKCQRGYGNEKATSESE